MLVGCSGWFVSVVVANGEGDILPIEGRMNVGVTGGMYEDHGVAHMKKELVQKEAHRIERLHFRNVQRSFH